MALRAVPPSERQRLDELLRTGGVRNLSRNTLAGYRADWKLYTAWCRREKLQPFAADSPTALRYLHHLVATGHKVSTARRHAAALNSYARDRGQALPVTAEARAFLLGAKRLRGEQPAQKKPITVEQLREMCARLPATKRGLRNRAILCVGFASALRRSNLVALDLSDVIPVSEGLLLTVRAEKQDRQGEGRLVAIARGKNRDVCPAEAAERWLRARGLAPGPFFTRRYRGKLGRLLPKQIGVLIKKAVASIGLDPEQYGGHTLRSAFVTCALEQNVGEILVAAHVGHRSLETTRRYFRRTDPWKGNPSGMIGI